MVNEHLDNLNAAMAEQTPSAAESSADGRKTRRSPITATYDHCAALILGRSKTDDEDAISGMLQGWQAEANEAAAKGDEVALQVAEAVCSALSTLASKITTLRDMPRETVGIGKHYVGVKADGNRSAFQASSIPNAKQYPSFTAVYGPYGVQQGALYAANKGINLAKAFQAPKVY